MLFLSGEVHWAEISRREFADLYPLYDVMASSITEMWYKIEPNSFRVGKVVPENHFEMLELDWDANSPHITMKIINHQRQTKSVESVDVKTLQFRK